MTGWEVLVGSLLPHDMTVLIVAYTAAVQTMQKLRPK
jgi:hypothetical protein